MSTDAETCTVCGKPAEGAAGFAHVWHEGRRLALCCPGCLQLFERARERFARGERLESVLDELMREMRWKDADR